MRAKAPMTYKRSAKVDTRLPQRDCASWVNFALNIFQDFLFTYFEQQQQLSVFWNLLTSKTSFIIKKAENQC